MNAIHDRRAHFTRAGYFATPERATPSPICSSSPGSSPLLVSIERIASNVSRAWATDSPVISSARIDAEATLIEQPIAS